MKRYVKSDSEYAVALNAKHREFAIFLFIEDGRKPLDELDVISLFRGYEGPYDISPDYKKLCRTLVRKYNSYCRENRRYGYECQVAAIAPYYEEGHPHYGTEFGNVLAYLDYEGNFIEEFPNGNFNPKYFDDDM